MMDQIKKTFSILIALVLLSGGNFAYAISHGDCIVDEHGHKTCEMECCKVDPCDDDEADGTMKIVDESNSCCKSHIGPSGEQGTPVLLHVNKTVISKFVIASETAVTCQLNPKGFDQVIHKFKTTNILLINSILRI